MGEGLLLAVEVPATVFTEEMAFIRGPMVLSLIVVCQLFCVDFPATVVTHKRFHITSGFPPVPRQFTDITPSPLSIPLVSSCPYPSSEPHLVRLAQSSHGKIQVYKSICPQCF